MNPSRARAPRSRSAAGRTVGHTAGNSARSSTGRAVAMAARSAVLAMVAAIACGCSGGPAGIAVRTSEGATVRPLAVPEGRIHVLVFTTTDCPIANAYAPRIAELAAAWRGSEVRPFLVHVDPDATAASVQEHARDYGLELPLVLDPRHELATAVGATRTPEACVCTADGVQYLGRIDDRWRGLGQDGQTARHHDLADAVADLRAGRPVRVPRTEAVGCLLPSPE